MIHKSGMLPMAIKKDSEPSTEGDGLKPALSAFVGGK